MKFGFPSIDLQYDWVSLVNEFKKHATKKSIVLEIGASTVERTRQLSPYCKKIIGVEYFSKRLPANFANITYVKGDWQTLTKLIKKKSIDIAISNQVIEHVEKDMQALNELYEALKPGGIALISTPNRTRLLQKMSDLISGKERTFPWAEHIREYTLEDATRLIKKTKFKKFKIIPLVFGLHAGPFYAYFESVPKPLANYVNFLEFHLYKN